MRKPYAVWYFKNLWKTIWRTTRQEKGNISRYMVSAHFKHVNKMYIMAKMLYNSKITGKNNPDFSGVNIKFEM